MTTTPQDRDGGKTDTHALYLSLMTKTGPNNASGIIWALVSFFFLFSSFDYLTNVLCVLRFYCTNYRLGRKEEAGNDRNRPKRSQACHLSPGYGQYLLPEGQLTPVLFIFPNDKNRPKRHVWHRLGPSEFFFSFFKLTNVLCVLRFYCTNYRLGRKGEAGDDRNRPK
jgi:hypothetical protein